MSEATAAAPDETRPPTEAASEEATPRPDATPVAKLAQRDGGIALAALSLFAATDAWYSVTGLAFAAVLSTAVGVVVGVKLGSLAHEWGHFAGARSFGGIAPTRPFRSLFPIFDLDLQKSDPRAFRAMSIGGNLGHWAVVLLVLWVLPLDAAGRMALFAASFGFAVSASLTEFPIITRVFSGSSPVESFRGLTGDKLRRDRRIGALAGLVLFALL